MKTRLEIRNWLLENAVDEDGDLMLDYLDFSEFDGDVIISEMKVKGNLSQDFQEVKGDLYQGHQEVQGNLFQDNHEVQGDLYQCGQEVEGDLYNRLQWEENFQKGNEIEILREIVEQYKQPTFDEVVKAWEDTIDDRLEFKNNDEGIRIIYPNGIYYLINCEQVYSNRKVFSMNVNATLKAINLTVEYLKNRQII